MSDLEIDRIDLKILDLLQRDAGLSNLELADRVGLTATPCARRVKRLEKELGAFVADSRRTAHSLRPMRRAERRKAHAVCEVYGVGTRSYDRSPERHIRILREPGAPAPSLPDVLLSEAAALPAVSVLPEPAPALPEAPPTTKSQN